MLGQRWANVTHMYVHLMKLTVLGQRWANVTIIKSKSLFIFFFFFQKMDKFNVCQLKYYLTVTIKLIRFCVTNGST